MDQHDVVVIGAGLAGLYAALALRQAGLNIVVLEARERVGGRTLTDIDEYGVTYERGAQWLSPHYKRMLELVRRYGLTLLQADTAGKTIYDLNGRRKVSRTAIPSLPILGLADLFLLQRKIDKTARKLPVVLPALSETGRQLDAVSMKQWLQEHARTESGKAFYQMYVEEACCAPSDEYSALDVLLHIQSAGSIGRLQTTEQLWLKEGTQTLAIRMMEELGDRVKLGCAVDRISYNQSGEGDIVIESRGRQYCARRVIIAIPPFLADRIQFDPPLPDNRRALMRSYVPGSVIKCRLAYETRFWRSDGYSGSAYWDGGATSYVTDTTAPGQRGGTLTAFVTGNQARRLSDDAGRRRDEVVRSLVHLFGAQAEKPVQYTDTNWMDDPWALGGYSGHTGPGVMAKSRETIADRIGPLHFAGTETASEWRSFMEGALQSGERAAEEVLQSLRSQASVSDRHL